MYPQPHMGPWSDLVSSDPLDYSIYIVCHLAVSVNRIAMLLCSGSFSKASANVLSFD